MCASIIPQLLCRWLKRDHGICNSIDRSKPSELDYIVIRSASDTGENGKAAKIPVYRDIAVYRDAYI